MKPNCFVYSIRNQTVSQLHLGGHNLQTNNQATLPDVKHTVVMNAPIQKVWDAVTTSEGIAAWLMPNTFVPGLGQEFTITSQFGVSPCKVTEFDPPQRMKYSWDEDWVIAFE